jgi:hypothetical protein
MNWADVTAALTATSAVHGTHGRTSGTMSTGKTPADVGDRYA